MPDTLLIGSGNLDKAAELAGLLAPLGWTLRTLRDFPPVPEPEEEGKTFEENALLKASFYATHFGLPSVADDSGLQVDALGGAPGVYSARYAGDGCSYADNNAKLLRALEGTPPAGRRARFVCCAAYVDGARLTHVEHGTVEGRIAGVCRGGNGFGYDPLFIPDGYDLTFGELPPEVKHAVSHRGRAFRALCDWLGTLR